MIAVAALINDDPLNVRIGPGDQGAQVLGTKFIRDFFLRFARIGGHRPSGTFVGDR